MADCFANIDELEELIWLVTQKYITIVEERLPAEIAKAIDTEVNCHYEQVINRLISLLCDYINRFDVDVSDGIDELKIVYWMNKAIINVVHPACRYYIDDIMLLIMLEISLGKPNNCENKTDFIEKFMGKIKYMQYQDRVKNYLGEYGVYFMFKMINEMCVPCPTSPEV